MKLSEPIRTWVVRLVATLTFAAGILAINRPLAERVPDRVEALVVPLNVDFVGRTLDLLIGLALVYLALQLWQRKLAAWWLTVGALALLCFSSSATGRQLVPSLYFGALLIALVVAREAFTSRSEPMQIRRGIAVFSGSLLLALAYGTTGFYLLDQRDFGISFSLVESFTRTIRAYLLIGNDNIVAHTRHAEWFLRSLGVIGAASLTFGFYSLFRPIAYRYSELPAERARAGKFVADHSISSDDYFKLWPHDKSYFFGSDGKAMLAYGVARGVAVSVGDPLGEVKSVESVIREFDTLCGTHGWASSYMYIGSQNRDALLGNGYELIKVGEDAVIDLTKFSTETANNKHFRNIRNRFNKQGYSAELLASPHDSNLLRELERVSSAWLAVSGRKEWQLLSGYFSPAYMATSSIFVVRDEQGEVQAFANQIPVFVAGYATIDLMRYRPEAPSNIMDYLLLKLALEFASAGYDHFNLGLAPLSGLDLPDAQAEERILDLIYRSRQSYVALKGLRQFKAKFEPGWEPRYMAYKGSIVTLPRIVLALNKLMRH